MRRGTSAAGRKTISYVSRIALFTHWNTNIKTVILFSFVLANVVLKVYAACVSKSALNKICNLKCFLLQNFIFHSEHKIEPNSNVHVL
jgi:hypothetical protein